VAEHVLVVDDDRDLCLFLAAGLPRGGVQVSWKTCPLDALAFVETVDVDAVVADVKMAEMSGFELCERIVANHPDVPVVLLTALDSFDAAISAIRVGACDFMTKPPDIEALAAALRRAVRHRRLQGQVKRLGAAPQTSPIQDLIGASPAMHALCNVVDRVAGSDASVLIVGESGTGKELVARALHRRGGRSAGPFVSVNCAALPEGLLESELFGHVRGAFTDARAARSGLFLQASTGTLLLDEIAELPPALQPKLLRALQERTVRPVGGDTELSCDVRLVAATNRDLEVAVEEGRLREDLFFRINVITLRVPPLRDRGDDVLLLAQHFLDRCAAKSSKRVLGLSPTAAECLLAYPWPGNVRELQNCIEHAVVFARYEEIVVDDLPERVRGPVSTRALRAGQNVSSLLSLEEAERMHVLGVMEAARGNQTLAAQLLSIDRKTLHRKLKRYDFPRSHETGPDAVSERKMPSMAAARTSSVPPVRR